VPFGANLITIVFSWSFLLFDVLEASYAISCRLGARKYVRVTLDTSVRLAGYLALTLKASKAGEQTFQ